MLLNSVRSKYGIINTQEFAKKASKGPYKGKPRKDIANIKIKKETAFYNRENFFNLFLV